MTAGPFPSEDRPDPKRQLDAAVLALVRLLARQAVAEGSAVLTPQAQETDDAAQDAHHAADGQSDQAG